MSDDSVVGYIADLPVYLGYQVTTEATITVLDPDSLVVGCLVLPDGIAPDRALDACRQLHTGCRARDQRPTTVLLTVHHPATSQLSHLLRADRLSALVAEAGLAADVRVWCVDGVQAWPLNTPDRRVTLPRRGPQSGPLELLNGSPAPDRRAALGRFGPRSGPLRDALADVLPQAVERARTAIAEQGAARWRIGALGQTLDRLSDPQPLLAAEAADGLLALADVRVREHVQAAAARGSAVSRAIHPSSRGFAPDTAHLITLARQAPSGLAAGAAEVLAVTFLAGGQATSLIRAAHMAARYDDPTSSVGQRALDHATQPDDLLAELARPRPLTGPGSDRAPAFIHGPGRWPDPLAGGTYPTDPDPLLGPPDQREWGPEPFRRDDPPQPEL